MKNASFVAVMLAALCAGAQQTSQPKNDQPPQPQSASQATEPKSGNTAQSPADKKAQPPDNAASDKEAAKRQTSTTPPAAAAPFGRIPVVCLQHTAWWVHMDPTWSFGPGDFTLGDDSIQLSCPDKNFSVQIRDIRSLERKSAPAGLPYLRIVPRNGKKFDFFPTQATDRFKYAGDETLASVEKAIRDRASQLGVVLK